MLTPIKNNHQRKQPIFSSQTYLEYSCAFCDICFAIVDGWTDFYYKCQSCNDIIACVACIKEPKHRLISHSPEHLFTPDKRRSENHWTNRNLSITCDICKKKHFPGKLYRCRYCCNYNVCSDCLNEAKTTHFPSEEHLFDFIPNPTRIRLNRYLIALRAKQLLSYRNAGPPERDPITGWTIDEATIIYNQSWNLYCTAWREASKLLGDEDMSSPPSIIQHEKSAKILVSLSNNN